MKMKVNISGLNRLQKKLIESADPVRIEKVVKANTAQLQANAQKKAPVSTGQLQRSIQLSVAGTEGIVRATADYAEYVEKGTRFKDAQPYMKPALDEQKQKFLRDLKRAVAGR